MAKVYEIQFGCRNDAEILKVQLRGLVNHLEGVHDHWRVCCIEKPTILSRECRMNHPKKPFILTQTSIRKPWFWGILLKKQGFDFTIFMYEVKFVKIWDLIEWYNSDLSIILRSWFLRQIKSAGLQKGYICISIIAVVSIYAVRFPIHIIYKSVYIGKQRDQAIRWQHLNKRSRDLHQCESLISTRPNWPISGSSKDASYAWCKIELYISANGHGTRPALCEIANVLHIPQNPCWDRYIYQLGWINARIQQRCWNTPHSQNIAVHCGNEHFVAKPCSGQFWKLWSEEY